MFCVKCGEKMDEGAIFCQKCGTKVGGITPGEVSANGQSVQPILSQPIPANSTPETITSVRVLAVLGMVFFSSFLFIFFISYSIPPEMSMNIEDMQQLGRMGVILFLVQAVVVYVLSKKHNLTVIKSWTFSGIIFCILVQVLSSAIGLNLGLDSDIISVLQILLLIYALIFSIVCYRKAKKNVS